MDFFKSGPSWLPVAVGGGAVVLLAGALLFRKGSKKPFVLSDDYKEKDVVYLFHFGRVPSGPDPSSFCVKMETFLRMNGIKYKAITTQQMGPKDKMPYIAYNGQVISDSDFIVDFLIKELQLKCDSDLDESQRAVGHVTCQMLEENTYWAIVHYRWVQNVRQLPDLFVNSPGTVMRLFLRYMIAPKVEKSCYAQGMGRHSVAEINQIAERDFRSLSTILGDKPYLLGETATSHDATVFGTTATVLYSGEGSAAHTLLTTELLNVRDYTQRIRDRWFPDWDDRCLKD
ncbi:failed axon connections homolog isoform X3 [Sycon ciliatum]|uniref:failed axon connections homolog isoform X3 n=1 Tax=Sycon ciliatum TaxID=27933 RepID=UPI0031F61F54